MSSHIHEQIAERIRTEHRKHSTIDWPYIAARKLLATPEFRAGWLSVQLNLPRLGQLVDVWVVPPPEHRYPAMEPYRVTDLTYTEAGYRCGKNGPEQHHVMYWMPTPVAP